MTKPKFGIQALTKIAKEPPKIVRMKLRKLAIKKDGRYYDFGSQKQLEEIAAKL